MPLRRFFNELRGVDEELDAFSESLDRNSQSFDRNLEGLDSLNKRYEDFGQNSKDFVSAIERQDREIHRSNTRTLHAYNESIRETNTLQRQYSQNLKTVRTETRRLDSAQSRLNQAGRAREAAQRNLRDVRQATTTTGLTRAARLGIRIGGGAAAGGPVGAAAAAGTAIPGVADQTVQSIIARRRARDKLTQATLKYEQAQRNLTRQSGILDREIGNLNRTEGQYGASQLRSAQIQDNYIRSTNRLQRGLQRLGQRMGGITGLAVSGVARLGLFSTALAGAAIAAGTFVNASNELIDSQNALRSALQTTDIEQEFAQAAISAARIRADVFETTTLAARLTQFGGFNFDEAVTGATVIQQAIQLSGTSAVEAEGGIRQLIQGIARGQLRGQELNAVLEQMPFLARLFAKELGVAPGQLHLIAQEGRITGEVMRTALVNNAGAVQEQFDNIEVSASRAFGTLGDGITLYAGQIGRAIIQTEIFGTTLTDIVQGAGERLIAAATGGEVPQDTPSQLRARAAQFRRNAEVIRARDQESGRFANFPGLQERFTERTTAPLLRQAEELIQRAEVLESRIEHNQALAAMEVQIPGIAELAQQSAAAIDSTAGLTEEEIQAALQEQDAILRAETEFFHNFADEEARRLFERLAEQAKREQEAIEAADSVLQERTEAFHDFYDEQQGNFFQGLREAEERRQQQEQEAIEAADKALQERSEQFHAFYNEQQGRFLAGLRDPEEEEQQRLAQRRQFAGDLLGGISSDVRRAIRRGRLDGIGDAIIGRIAETTLNAAFQGIGQALLGSQGALGGFLRGIFGAPGGRASGGAVAAGQLVRINEGASRGREEFFRANQAGRVFQQNPGGQAPTIIQNIYPRVPEEFRDMLYRFGDDIKAIQAA